MRPMSVESLTDLSQFRVTLFVGPQPVKGKPFTHATVFNVKRRSWKGGIQVAVELTQVQIDHLNRAIGFPQWLSEALETVSQDERAGYQLRAEELFIQALSWCKLDLLLQSGITQENQCLTADTFVAELNEVTTERRDFVASHVAQELDLLPNDTTS
jgi:hypothetical protein